MTLLDDSQLHELGTSGDVSEGDIASGEHVSAAAYVESARRGPTLGEGTGLYELLVDSVQDYAIFALDPGGYIISWNAGAARIKGYTRSEILGKHFSIFYPADRIAEGFPEYELKVASRTGRFEDEGWRIRKDGTRFWASVVITALRDNTNALVGFAKVTRDLSERRAAEQALRQSEERFRLIIQSVRDYAIFMLDPSGRVATWNEGAQRIEGYAPEEIIGQDSSVFYTEPEIARGKLASDLAIASRDGRFDEETWQVRKDGSLFWASVVVTPLRGESGDLLGFVKVTRDLTERRAAEEKAIEDARRVAAAEATSRVKSEFLATLSHELRTPLNAIGGYTELLSLGVYGATTEAQRDILSRISGSQRHLLTLISDLLNFSRVEAGQISYAFGPVALSGVAAKALSMVEPQATTKGVTVEQLPCEEGIVAWADQAKVEQIMLNLMSNAVKFTEAGGRVAVRCELDPSAALIIVTDTGPGIPLDQREAIFEPFVQLGRSLSNPQEGTGLGLSISRELAHAMGGDLRAGGTPGEGAVFTLSLPIAQPQ